MVNNISDSDFVKEVEQDPGVVLVDFWAPWCGPCRMMAPVYEKTAEKMPSIKFCKVNTDENQVNAQKYGISGIPCIIVYKQGKEAGRIVGYLPEAQLEQEISKYAQSNS